MNLSIATSLLLLLLGPSVVSAIFPAPLELRKQGECIDGHKKDLRGDAAHPPSLKVEELVLTEEQCQQLLNTTTDEEFDNGSTVSGVRFFTKIDIAEDVYKKLRDPSLAKDGKLEVSISRVLKTTPSHRDGYYGNDHLGVPEGALVDEEVTLLFLNDNYGASFVYGNEKVPVKCGTKVTFNGGHTHNTELLAGGTVKFLGPLTMSSGLISVDYDGQCESSIYSGCFCSCAACDAENLYGGTSYVDSCCNDYTGNAPAGTCVDAFAYNNDPSICPPRFLKGREVHESSEANQRPKEQQGYEVISEAKYKGEREVTNQVEVIRGGCLLPMVRVERSQAILAVDVRIPHQCAFLLY